MRTKLATAARWARQRPRTNQQGIALQTVIVIVVMLVIAGGVSGVLLSRGSDVIGDLEAQGVTAVNLDTCTATELNGLAGVALTATGGNNGGCSWTGTVAQPISLVVCNTVRSSSNGSAGSHRYTAAGDAAAAQAASGANVALPALVSGSNVGGLCQIAF